MELRDFLEVLKNRKWIVIQAVVIITATVIILSRLQTPVYVATSKVMVTERAVTNLFGQMSFPWRSYDASIETQMQLVKSPPVAEEVIKELKLPIDYESLLGQIQTEQVGETSLITISAQDSDPQKAKDIANAFAVSYVKWSEDSSQDQSRVLRKELTGEIRDTREDILNIGKKIDEKAPDQPVSEDERIQLDLATKFYAMLAEKNQELKINERLQSSNIELVAPATTPGVPISPTPTKNGIFAFIAGLIFGCSLALFVEYLDNTIKTSDDVDRYFKLPLLGQIPIEVPSGNGSRRKTVPYKYSRSSGAEAYRSLRTNIQYLSYRSKQTMVVTSASPEEGKSTVLANLAVTLAQAGNKVIVVCCDLRRPSMHKMFNVDNSAGLSDVLIGKLAFENALQEPCNGNGSDVTDLSDVLVCKLANKNQPEESCVDKIRILPSGPLPPNPSELLGSDQMKEVLRQANEMADIVLIDTPPALAVTDCAVVSPQVDGVMIVVSSGHTTRDVAKQIKERLESVNAHLLGVVLNNVASGRGYGRYYHYYHKDDNSEKGRMGKRGNGSGGNGKKAMKRVLSSLKIF